MRLSIVIATYNEEKNIVRCLESIKDIAEEIILVDGSSSDKTVELAKKYTSKIFVVKNEPLFHKNKQFGLDKAEGEWILQLDADEVVSQSLKHEITKTLKQDQGFNGYYLPRKNYFLGKWMKKGGLYPDYLIRLVRKGKAFFPCESVHEQIKVIGPVGWLKNPLYHYPYPSVSDYLVKAGRYTTLTAEELARKNTRINLKNTFKYFFFIPLKTFFNIYLKHRGFEDGLAGFVWAFFSSSHFLFAYIKLIEKSGRRQ